MPTLKGLEGISLPSAITFISQLYAGSISDREIVERGGILDLPFNELQEDSVMADKGFTISEISPLGVSLNIPPFLGTSTHAPGYVLKTQEIARLRIHVEREINKIIFNNYSQRWRCLWNVFGQIATHDFLSKFIMTALSIGNYIKLRCCTTVLSLKLAPFRIWLISSLVHQCIKRFIRVLLYICLLMGFEVHACSGI